MVNGVSKFVRSGKENAVQFHRGRLVDHVHLRVAELERSKRFYRSVFEALGLPGILNEGPGFFQADELFVDVADGDVSRVHLAFQAPDRETVQSFYDAALAPPGLLRGFRARSRRQQHRGRVPRSVRAEREVRGDHREVSDTIPSSPPGGRHQRLVEPSHHARIPGATSTTSRSRQLRQGSSSFAACRSRRNSSMMKRPSGESK
jgi:catechol 2,3-dioxygenase-like lactoylglutathione lyase family enzyme